MTAVRRIRDCSKRYKDMYGNTLDQKIAHIIQCVDAPNNTLFEIIDKIRKEYPSIDPELVQIIIQGELDRQISAPACTCCGTKVHKKYSIKKECVTTIGTIVIGCPYYVCPKCKAVHIRKFALAMGTLRRFREKAEEISNAQRVITTD